jgi:hypothetical protein
MNLESLKNTWNGWSTKKKIIVVFFVLVLLGSLAPKKDKGNVSDSPPPAPIATQETAPSSAQVQTQSPAEQREWASASGETESQWISRCKKHEAAKQACAVADRPGACMGIKLGDHDRDIGNMYCVNGTPDWFSMGRR